jgi:hypothetical protein
MPRYFPDFAAKTGQPVESHALYEHRRWYKEKTTEIYKFNNNYIDLWYDVPYYGKTNRAGILKVPQKEKLVYSANNNLVTFKFVSQAFDEFVFFLQRGSVVGRTNLRKFLGDFKVKRSYRDSVLEYLNYSSALMAAFNSFIVNEAKIVLDLETYTCELLKFLKLNEASFSFYSFFAGHKTSIGATGLAIEFSTENHDDDRTKNRFFKNPEFYKYVKTAANFGFRINKNAPWMLIADLNSKPMKNGHKVKRSGKIIEVPGYLPNDFIPSIDYLFEEYYDRVMLKALTLLRTTIEFGYKKFQNDMQYLVRHGEVVFQPGSGYKMISNANVTKLPAGHLFIKSYKSSRYGSPPSLFTDLADLSKAPQFTDAFYLKILEKTLMYEFSVDNDVKYRTFKRKFDKKNNNSNISLFVVLDLLESFYSPTKIFDPVTKKPMWTNPKNKLTSQNQNVMIPNEKQKPTVSKTVTEFYTGYE